MRTLLHASLVLLVASENPPVECPANAVAQDDLPCPGNTEDVPLPSLNVHEPNKTGVRLLPVPGSKPDPFGCAPNAEGKPELLGAHDITPFQNLYTRNHGTIPPRARAKSLEGWTLTIDGEVDRPTTFTMEQLRTSFTAVSRQHVLECGARHPNEPRAQHLAEPSASGA